MTASTRSTAAPAGLAAGRLGVPQVLYFALSGVAPLTVSAKTESGVGSLGSEGARHRRSRAAPSRSVVVTARRAQGA